jgi:ribosome-associated protein
MKWVARISYHEFRFEFARSGGPGGQHVNRTNSAAILRWNLPASVSFTDHEKAFLQTKLANRLNKEGDILIRSEEFRDQAQNKKSCLEKLDAILERAFHIPKKRKATKPTKASREKRKKTKKIRSEIKKMRSTKWT